MSASWLVSRFTEWASAGSISHSGTFSFLLLIPLILFCHMTGDRTWDLCVMMLYQLSHHAHHSCSMLIYLIWVASITNSRLSVWHRRWALWYFKNVRLTRCGGTIWRKSHHLTQWVVEVWLSFSGSIIVDCIYVMAVYVISSVSVRVGWMDGSSQNYASGGGHCHYQ